MWGTTRSCVSGGQSRSAWGSHTPDCVNLRQTSYSLVFSPPGDVPGTRVDILQVSNIPFSVFCVFFTSCEARLPISLRPSWSEWILRLLSVWPSWPPKPGHVDFSLTPTMIWQRLNITYELNWFPCQRLAPVFVPKGESCVCCGEDVCCYDFGRF